MCEPELGFQDSVSVCAVVCFGRGMGVCVCVCVCVRVRVRWLPTSQWKVQHPSLALRRCAERPGAGLADTVGQADVIYSRQNKCVVVI